MGKKDCLADRPAAVTVFFLELNSIRAKTQELLALIKLCFVQIYTMEL